MQTLSERFTALRSHQGVPRYSPILWALFLLLWGLPAGVFTGCGGQDALEFQQTGTGLHYRMTSGTGKLPPGRRATFLVGNCPAGACPQVSSLHQAYSAVAGADGGVPVEFTVPYAELEPLFLSVYLDVNDNHLMDAGDWVWGTNPANFTGYGAKARTVFFQLAATEWWEQADIWWVQYAGGIRPW